jgi:HEPN domain-containing protein
MKCDDYAALLLRLAESDIAAYRVLSVSHDVRVETAMFHAQQAVEKMLKSVLISMGVEFRKTHDLIELADKVESHGRHLPLEKERLSQLIPYAVALRYDDDQTGDLTFEETDQIISLIRKWCIDP